MSSNDVKQAGAANIGILAYSIALTLAGVGVIVGTVLNGWSVVGYLGGGFLIVVGGSMLVSRLRGGLKYVAVACPRCKAEQTFAEEALSAGRVAPCKSCFQYMERDVQGMRAVPEDRVAEQATFESPFPAGGVNWEAACVLCGGPPTENERVTGSTIKAVVGGKTRITRTIDVPVCSAHRGANAVQLGAGYYIQGEESFAVSFRSHTECLRFRRNNPTPMKVSSAAVTFGRG